jgi:hypothetical protein
MNGLMSLMTAPGHAWSKISGRAAGENQGIGVSTAE